MQDREAGGMVAPLQPRLRHLARRLQPAAGSRKALSSRLQHMIASAGSSRYSRPLAQMPNPTVPTQCGDPGTAAQEIHDLAEAVGERVGRVDEAEGSGAYPAARTAPGTPPRPGRQLAAAAWP